jgi:hypothetical protein
MQELSFKELQAKVKGMSERNIKNPFSSVPKEVTQFWTKYVSSKLSIKYQIETEIVLFPPIALTGCRLIWD